MTRLRIDFEPDPDDGGTPHRLDLDTINGGRFFVAWVGPDGDIEWINTDEEYGGDHFGWLEAVMQR